MIFGAILAGGSGSRMHMAERPKQFLPLGEKPIIIHTIEKFLMCEQLDYIYVGIHPDWLNHMEDLIEKYIPGEHSRICLVGGGADRNETIQNIICAIEEAHGQSKEHILVTHDAVRPFVTLRILEENIAAAKTYGAVDTVTAAIDTIVVSEDGQTIKDIPVRSHMYQGQTPQSFRMELLKNLYASLSPEEKSILTDACKICTVRNYPVYLVKGSVMNMKITTPEDYKIAQAIMGRDPA